MPAVVATSSRRRIAMGVMLALAVSGGVIRHYAPAPSTLRDIGTLLLVIWLPAVGNLIAYVIGKLPRREPPPTDFPAGSTFTPQVEVRVETVPLPDGWLGALEPDERRAVLLVKRHGFTVRLAQPVARWLTQDASPSLWLELLRPASARKQLTPGTDLHVLVGPTVVAKGTVVSIAAEPQPRA
ncbi:hypothetical protein ACPWT1_13015 [Ramlibacter sp. MMS24-I3-19]|uniref:hypothetical protein n=1 Tax=Ramlibacter sp. MMS24-I3-19 TaxID=3416606 RepID=UPI003CFDD0D5